MDEARPPIEIGAPRDEAELSVILMHGLGADGHDFEDFATMFADVARPRRWRFVLPHAREMPVTVNGGMVMPAWYDILDMAQPRQVDWGTVAASTLLIEGLLTAEVAPRVVLAGFSQGGAMALQVGLRHQERVAGILVMSGYLLESDLDPTPGKAAEFPIGMFHGRLDEIVPFSAAERTAEALREKGFDPSFTAYDDLEHAVGEDEVRAVFAWLERL